MENRTKTSRRKAPSKSKSNTGKRVVLSFFVIVAVMVTGIGCGFLTASMNTKPDLANDIRPPATSTIYDVNGNELANVHATENRMPVKIAQVPKNLQNAFVAVEDNRFYDHMGIDFRGILRAVWSNISGRTIAEGGSTITQQLAKNAYLTQERTLKRKVQEVFLALQLERQYTKQEILELYLNQIYFGEGAYGVQAAAKTYFNKNVEDLTLNECAMLAGIPKSPNYYSPLTNLQAAQDRKATVLEQMVKYGYIDSQNASQAKKESLNLVSPAQKETNEASYFIDYVTQILIDKYGADAVYKEGLKIYTTLDIDMQRAAEEAMQHLPTYMTDDNGVKQPQGALVCIDPHTGHIKAMVGGRGTDQFNRATMAERQPGSAFKPFVFAAALENKFTPSTVIDDSPLKIGSWAPQNYTRTFSGKVSLRKVAEQSLNVPTVKIAQKLGIEKPIYYAQEMGISTFVMEGPQNDKNLSTALGGLTKGVTPLEITSAYGTFANKGVHVSPVAIVKILDRNGKVLEEATAEQRSVISEASASELTGMLEGVIQHGTGTRANIGRPAAGKTGTTSDYHDAWFVGYTPDLVAGVWIGNDNNTSLNGMGGGNQPAEIWKMFMVKASKDIPVHGFDGTHVSNADAIGELADEKNSDSAKNDTNNEKKTQADEKEKQDAKNTPSPDNGTSASQSKSATETPATPAQNTPSTPSAEQPAVSGPAPTRGVSKGKN